MKAPGRLREMLKKLKGNIRRKILIMGVWIPLVSLLVFAYMSIDTVIYLEENSAQLSQRLGDEAAESIKITGNNTGNTLKTMIEVTLTHISRIAEDKVKQKNILIKEMQNNVDILGELAVREMTSSTPSVILRSYSNQERPPDIYLTSVYGLAPDTSLDLVREELNRSAGLDRILINLFKPLIDKDKCISGVTIAFPSGLYRVYPWGQLADTSFDPRVRPWYRMAVYHQGIVWTDPYFGAGSNKLMVTCARALVDSKGRFIGVVGADLGIDLMEEKTLNTALAKYSFAFFMDNKGTNINYTNLEKQETHLKELFTRKNLLESQHPEVKKILAAMAQGKTGLDSWKNREEVIYIAYAPFHFQDKKWSLGIVFPTKKIMKPLKEINATSDKIKKETHETAWKIKKEKNILLLYLITLFVFITVLVIALSLRWSKKIIDPLARLAKGAAVLGSGNLDHQMDIKTGDELEIMAGAFNKMAKDLKLYMKNLEETTTAKERIESDLRVANQIQTSMLPRIFPPFPNRKEVDIYALMDPAKEVGGDFYDFFFVTENKLFFLIADVTGKGVPASLFMAISKTLIKNEALRDVPPLEVLNNVNKIIIPDNDESMFVTVFCAVLDVKTGKLQYGIAGHNPPLLYRSGEDFQYLKPKKSFVLGVMDTAKFASAGFTLKPGDTLFLYSDGVTEAMNENDELFSEKRLQESLGPLKEKNAREITLGIKKAAADFVQKAPQSDDLTILVLRFNGPGVI